VRVIEAAIKRGRGISTGGSPCGTTRRHSRWESAT